MAKKRLITYDKYSDKRNIKKLRNMQITREQLVAIMPHAGQRVDTYLPLLNKFAEEFLRSNIIRHLHRGGKHNHA